MDSPIILLIFWGLINLFLKSSKDKKKAEESKQRRINQNAPQNTSTNKKPKSIIDVFKDEIQKEIQREKEAQQKKERPLMQSKEIKPTPKPRSNQRPKQTLVSEKTTEQIKRDRENYFQATDLSQMDGIKEGGNMEVVRVSSLTDEVEGKTKSTFNIKNDLLKGIIYSEILSEAKALKNMKR